MVLEMAYMCFEINITQQKHLSLDFFPQESTMGRTTMFETCSELTIKTPERYQCGGSGVYITNFEIMYI